MVLVLDTPVLTIVGVISDSTMRIDVIHYMPIGVALRTIMIIFIVLIWSSAT